MEHNYKKSLLFVLVFISFVLCTNIVEVNSNPITYGRMYNFSYIQSNDTSMPDHLTLDVTMDGNELHLQLGMNKGLDQEIPVYALSKDAKKVLHRTRVHLRQEKNYGLYHDSNHSAIFRAYHETDETDTKQLFLEGLIHADGKLYDLKSTGRYLKDNNTRSRRDANSSKNEDDDVKQEFEVKKHQFSSQYFTDYVVRAKTTPPESIMLNWSSPFPPPATKGRRKRQTFSVVNLDICAIADYAVYRSWLDESTATTDSAKMKDAMEKIRQRYSFVFNGINILYQSINTLSYKIIVRLTNIIVATSSSASEWTEKFKVLATPRMQVDSNNSLYEFAKWLGSTDALSMVYDHVMLFSGYDLTSTDDGIISNGNAGRGFLGTACNTMGLASSIVEDRGGFDCMFYAAHELGHSLSSRHDGDGNNCPAAVRNLMSPVQDLQPAPNPWRFSTCSANYFNNFINTNVQNSRGRQCLLNALTRNDAIPEVSNQMEGQVYSPDDQCRQVYGPNSYVCRHVATSDICLKMFCFDPLSDNLCYNLVAARGTSCGNKQWCIEGQCVYDDRAPSVQSDCVFGDQPGIYSWNMTCAQLVSNWSGYCYGSWVREGCCHSCAEVYKPVQGPTTQPRQTSATKSSQTTTTTPSQATITTPSQATTTTPSQTTTTTPSQATTTPIPSTITRIPTSNRENPTTTTPGPTTTTQNPTSATQSHAMPSSTISTQNPIFIAQMMRTAFLLILVLFIVDIPWL